MELLTAEDVRNGQTGNYIAYSLAGKYPILTLRCTDDDSVIPVSIDPRDYGLSEPRKGSVVLAEEFVNSTEAYKAFCIFIADPESQPVNVGYDGKTGKLVRLKRGSSRLCVSSQSNEQK